MSDDPEGEATKKFQLELDSFGKRTQQRFRLIGDLSLCMRTCKTPELRLTLAEAARRAAAELERERKATENRINKDLQAAAKKAKKGKTKPVTSTKPADIAGKQKKTKLKLKLMVDQFNKKYLPSDNSVWLELSVKPKNEFPFVDYKKTTIMLNYKIMF